MVRLRSCISLLQYKIASLQIRRDFEGSRLERYFAKFWGAGQMAGSFSGLRTQELFYVFSFNIFGDSQPWVLFMIKSVDYVFIHFC